MYDMHEICRDGVTVHVATVNFPRDKFFAGNMLAMGDQKMTYLGDLAVVILVSPGDDKQDTVLFLSVPPHLADRVKAGVLAQHLSDLFDGKSGGRSDQARAWTRNHGDVKKALDTLPGLVNQILEEKADVVYIDPRFGQSTTHFPIRIRPERTMTH